MQHAETSALLDELEGRGGVVVEAGLAVHGPIAAASFVRCEDWGGEGTPFRSESGQNDRRPRLPRPDPIPRPVERAEKGDREQTERAAAQAGAKRAAPMPPPAAAAAAAPTTAMGRQAPQRSWRTDQDRAFARHLGAGVAADPARTDFARQVADALLGQGASLGSPATGTPNGFWDAATLPERWSETREEIERRRLDRKQQWEQQRFSDGRAPPPQDHHLSDNPDLDPEPEHEPGSDARTRQSIRSRSSQ
jgi:hypothetical protein